ncbi:MAG: cysteine--tRNA ligase [Candidatus Harrisonbacteria bacterium CG10_big_fil_rev_8_21_14_0_10_38_8]|uniref:Cysteine--tRNA ligase n=1 Tax=Candidatus Harrisonbacteria bacterium CG10_big_fil_rev_8_21_14_0_10_38_8 TaxID=1974582 RepID=A0A2M6WKV5_9BACT|nr:MAG: cysteine--tRNA ligase [Candidatus Harrisonbacteria bacterium CG10_big_fil_rev_8_21_14_0_10_38_8]
MLHIYNTIQREKEEVKKPWFRSLKMFVCGPTVYSVPQIGNYRTFMAFDLLVRYMRYRGYKVTYIQNITDIDDKIIKMAGDENRSYQSIAREFEQLYLEDLRILKIHIDKQPRATDYIPEIIAQAVKLKEKGFLYEIEGGGWYMDISKIEDYGKLSKRNTLTSSDSISRIDEHEKKRNTGDFVVWKYSKEGEPSWDSPLGTGRPGWHIEDTAISEHFFGNQYDIHGGGSDLIFPHHEGEIAIAESSSGKKPFVKYWLHAGMLTVDKEKMSKSLNNFVTLSQVLENYSPDVFRMFVFSHHYRLPADYTQDTLETAKKNLGDITVLLAKLRMNRPHHHNTKIDVKSFKRAFLKALDDDFNSPAGLAVIFSMINEVNKVIWDIGKDNAEEIYGFIYESFSALGFSSMYFPVPKNVMKLALERELFRSNKQFTQSDDLRNKLEALGYTIEDTPLGPLVLLS